MRRFLYLPIFEQGKFHDVQVQQKRGLYNALMNNNCSVMEWDYLANDASTRFEGMVNRIEQFNPTHIFTQFHASNVLTWDQIENLRRQYPVIKWINWSGDSWNHSLITPNILELAKQYDLWLVAAPDVLPVYDQNGINARYWNIAYEHAKKPLPDMPHYDIVFLANVINDKRRHLMEYLRTLPYSVGVYGDWEHANGHNTYDFAQGESLYKTAKIIICDNTYEDRQTYISNRPMQAMIARGGLVLHQHVPKMIQLSGWQSGIHYIEWSNLDDLGTQIIHWMNPEYEVQRKDIVDAAYVYTLVHHSFDARVRQLLYDFLGEK